MLYQRALHYTNSQYQGDDGFALIARLKGGKEELIRERDKKEGMQRGVGNKGVTCIE